jgi:thymidine phosphorylase
VQAGAGVELHAKPGDAVTAGQPLFTLHTDTPERFARARGALDGAWAVAEDATGVPAAPTPVLERLA